MTGHAPAEKERLVLIMKKTYKIEVDCANCAQPPTPFLVWQRQPSAL